MTIADLNKVDAHAIADRHEDALAAAYQKVLRDAGRKAASRFRRLAPFAQTAAAGDEPKQPNWAPPNIGELVDLDLIAAQTAKATRTLHTTVLAAVLDAYGETTKSISGVDVGQPSFDVTNPSSIAMLDSFGARAGDVAKSVRDDLQKTIGDAYQQGFSVDRTAKQIVEQSDQFSVAQARMLARTSLNGIANGGSHAAAQAAGANFKTWLATEDERTRETHSDADGQTVPIGQQFDVGGESCDYPGDPALSDEEACNCRCTLTYSDSLAGSAAGEPYTDATIGGEMAPEPQITIPLNITIGQAQANALQERSASRLGGGLYVPIRPSTEGVDIDATTGGDFLLDDIRDAVGVGFYGIDELPFQATGSTSLPLSDRNLAWDAGAARKSLQPADFPKAHFWKDPDGPADQIGSYKFPFAKRINGELTAVWKGVTAGAQRLSAAKGVDTGAIEKKMAAYYRKAAAQYKDPSIKAPFASDDDAADAMTPEAHQFLDDGSGKCAMCGMSEGAAIHDTPAVTAAAPGPVWRAVLCVEGEPTEDGRLLAPGSTTWRELPLTLLCQTETAPGHDGAEVCGRIDRIWRDGMNIMGEGVFDAGDFGLEAARLVSEQTLRGISVDLAVLEYEIRQAPAAEPAGLDIADGLDVPGQPDELFVVTDGVIGAATICPFQAIANATIEVLTSSGPLTLRIARRMPAEGALTASAAGLAPAKPPAAWFENPGLRAPTPITVTDDGRIFGHAALWGTCHIGHPGTCVTPPRSPSGYRFFHLGAIDTDNGEVDVGTITLGTGHASLRLGSDEAQEHYDNTGTGGAHARVGEDSFGIWVAGALAPELSAERARTLKGAKLSGDWRQISGALELVGLLAVNVPGFPVPRPSARVASAGSDMERVALLAAGVPEAEEFSPHRAQVLAAKARGGAEAIAELARA